MVLWYVTKLIVFCINRLNGSRRFDSGTGGQRKNQKRSKKNERECVKMTARELWEYKKNEYDTFEGFLKMLTSLLMDEGGVDFVSFPDTEINDDALDEMGFWQ